MNVIWSSSSIAILNNQRVSIGLWPGWSCSPITSNYSSM